jgi:hypothetical protein
MPRIESLNMLLETSGKDFLAEEYGKVIENISKATISGALKNTDLSGTPSAGSVEAKRFVNAASKDYGTARAASKGDAVKAKPVTVAINVDKEIIEEIEEKDVSLYGVDSVVSRRVANHGKSMTRELERAFFAEANAAGSSLETDKTAINEKIEALIQQIENTKNDYVDGVDRDMISVVCNTATYGDLRNFLDKEAGNANVNTDAAEFGRFHGVKVYSSVYLPSGVSAIGMVEGSIAQPVLPTISNPQKIQLSNAIGFGVFYSYGTKAVMPDLIVKVGA